MPKLHAAIALLRCKMKSFAVAKRRLLDTDDVLVVAALCSSRESNNSWNADLTPPGPALGIDTIAIRPLMPFTLVVFACTKRATAGQVLARDSF